MKHTALLFILSLSLSIFSCSAPQSTEEEATTQESNTEQVDLGGQASVSDEVSDPNIVQVAVGSADHTTLVAAVKAAGLVDVLANNGPFTVFAPTNDAFAALPEGTVENLLKPENLIQLKEIVTFHAAPGIYKDNLLKDGQKLFMATGHYIDVKFEGEDVYVHGAKILGTVQATNGVIHVVDKVLLPPSN